MYLRIEHHLQIESFRHYIKQIQWLYLYWDEGFQPETKCYIIAVTWALMICLIRVHMLQSLG